MRNNEPQEVCFEQCSINKNSTCKVPEAVTSLVHENDNNQEHL